MSKHDDIEAIAYTLRHDFGLLTMHDRVVVLTEARQIYEHHVKPLQDKLDAAARELSLDAGDDVAIKAETDLVEACKLARQWLDAYNVKHMEYHDE